MLVLNREGRFHTESAPMESCRPAIIVSFGVAARCGLKGSQRSRNRFHLDPTRSEKTGQLVGFYQGCGRLLYLRPIAAASAPPEAIITPSSIMAATVSGFPLFRKNFFFCFSS